VSQATLFVAPTGGRFTLAYDAAGQQEFMLNPQVGRTSFAYDAAGRRRVEGDSTMSVVPSDVAASAQYAPPSQTGVAPSPLFQSLVSAALGGGS
jgi:hypothetical protein